MAGALQRLDVVDIHLQGKWIPPSVYQVLRIGQLFLIQVHESLRRRNIRVTQQPPGVFDPLLAANLGPALMPGRIQHQIVRQAGLVPQPRISPAEVSHFPCPAGRGQENWSARARADGLIEQLPELLALCGVGTYVASACAIGAAADQGSVQGNILCNFGENRAAFPSAWRG